MERSILTFKKHRLLTQCHSSHTVENMEITRDKPPRIRLNANSWLFVRLSPYCKTG